MDIKPDTIVFNSNTQKYDAALREFPTSLGSPVIRSTDTASWKKRGISKVNKRIQSKYIELKTAYEEMMKEYEYNRIIYNAKFSFEPIVGEVYHLYKRDNGECFLSLLSPTQCDFNSIGSYYLSTDHVWKKV